MKVFNCFGFDIQTEYTKTLADFVYDLKYENLPPEVIEKAKFMILHTIGVSVNARPVGLSKSAERVAMFSNGGEGGNATSWISGKKMSVPSAAFVNGTAADMLDWEDCTYTGHPSATVVPVTIGLSEYLKANGKDLITALVAGIEVFQRVSLAAGAPTESFDPKYGHGLANWPIWAASSAAAKMLGLNREQIDKTMGMTVLFHKLTSNLEQASMTDAYHYEHGQEAWCGVMAAMCAKEGVSNLLGALDIPYAFFEQFCPQHLPEPRYDWLNKDLGMRYTIMELLIKHWPANMWIQTPVELAHDIVKENDIDVNQIVEIIVDPAMNRPPRMHFRPEGFDSLFEAEFSTPYCIAACLLEDKPGANWYSDDNLKNPKLLALASKVKSGPTPQPAFPFAYFFESNGKHSFVRTVTIMLNDGTTYSKTSDLHKGSPTYMLTWEEFHKLFMDQTAFELGNEKSQGLYEFIKELENVQDVSEIGKFF